ncbi:MAG: xanthine dehydrogenase family protein subunit M [Pseudomonadota bacterium]
MNQPKPGGVMKAPDFAYERPATLADAIALLSRDDRDAAPLAGGQSLMPMMNFRMARPDLLVDLGSLGELKGIAASGSHLEIGAMTTYAELAGSSLIAEQAPLMALALPHIAHSAIRNRGTLGGSVALADPAAEMPAVLLALGAEIVLTGPAGSRTVPADAFFKGLFETDRRPDELVTLIRVPASDQHQRHGFYELARRHGDYAMAGVATVSSPDSLRIVFFAVSDRPVRAQAVEALLTSEDLGDPAAIDKALAGLDAIAFAEDLNASARTKRHLAGVVLKRALGQLA